MFVASRSRIAEGGLSGFYSACRQAAIRTNLRQRRDPKGQSPQERWLSEAFEDDCQADSTETTGSKWPNNHHDYDRNHRQGRNLIRYTEISAGTRIVIRCEIPAPTASQVMEVAKTQH